MTLIAEDLLLLLLHDEKGTAQTAYLGVALGGAVLVELALTETVEVGEKNMWGTAKVRTTAAPPPTDPVLAKAHATVAEKERTAQDLVHRLGKGLDDVLAERLAERGVLRREKGKVLGLFPVTRWPTADASHEQEVRHQLEAVLVQGTDPQPRTAALVALLHAVNKAHKVVDTSGIGTGAVRKRAKQIAKGDGEWAAKAVRDAVAASTTAVIAATTAATTGAAAGGG